MKDIINKIINYFSNIKYIEIKNFRLLTLSVISLILVCLLSLGSTYSLFSASNIDNNLNVYKTGVLDVTYTLSDESITFTDPVPTTPEDSKFVYPYTMTVNNDGNVDFLFDLKLNNTTATDSIDPQYIMVQVGKLEPISLANCTDNVIRTGIVVPAGEDATVDVRVWISDEIQNTELEKSFYAQMAVDGKAVPGKHDEIDNDVLKAKFSLVAFLECDELEEEYIEITNDQPFGPLPTPTKEEHMFLGWYLESDFQTLVTSNTIVNTTKHLHLYPKWKKNPVYRTLSFEPNGGTVTPTSKQVVVDEPFGDLPTPTKEGYSFDGWYLDSSYTNKITETTTVTLTANATAYAKWKANKYTVNFNLNGGTLSGATTTTVNYEEVKAMPGTPTKSYTVTFNTNNQSGASFGSTASKNANITFSGWSSTSGLNSSTAMVGSSSTSLSAWSGGVSKFNYYKNLTPTSGATVTLKANWGSVSSITTPTITKPDSNGKRYTCKWYANANATGTAVSGGGAYTPTSNITLYAYCSETTIIEYDITYDFSNCNNNSNSIVQVEENKQIGTLPSVTPKTGYSFKGWYTASSGGSTVSSTTIATKHVTYYAQCNPHTYKISYTLDKGSVGEGTANDTSGTYDSAVYIGNFPTIKYNVTFASNNQGATITGSTTATSIAEFTGWTAPSGLNTTTAKYGSSIGAIDTAWNSTTMKVGAAYSKNLTPTNGGTVTLAANYGSQGSVTCPTLSKPGYDCVWKNLSNTTLCTSGGSFTPTADTTANAFCTAKDYTIAYDYNGATSTGTNPVTGTYDSRVTINYQPYKTYTVTLNKNSNNITLSSTTLSSTATFAGWTGKSGLDTTNAKYGTTTTNINTAWNNASTKVTAQYFKNLNSSGGTVTLQANYNSYSAVTLPNITDSLTGYTCSWNTNQTGTGSTVSSGSYTPTSNITLYAKCTANTYTIKADSNTTNATYDTAKNIANPSAKTYTVSFNANSQNATYTSTSLTSSSTFTGWTATSGLNTSTAKYGTSAAGATTSWSSTSTKPKATYYKNLTTTSGGTVVLTSNYGAYSSVTLPTISKENNTCQWRKDSATGTAYNGGVSYTPSANTTFYASCSENSYTIKADSSTITGIYDKVVKIDKPSNKTYTVSFNANSQSATYTNTALTSTSTFTGWTATSGLNTSTAYYGSSSTTVSTRWSSTSTKPTVEYYKNLASIGGTITLTSNYGSYSAVTLPAITKTGYTCQWKEGSASGTAYNGGASYTPSANKTFYASCTASTYTITYNFNNCDGSTTSQTTPKTYGSKLGTLPTPSKTGYTQNGWYTAASGGTKISATTTVSGDKTYYAQCNAHTYNISYNYNGGTAGTYAPSSGTYDQNVRISNPKNPTYTVSFNANNQGATISSTQTLSSTASWSGWTASGLNTSTAKYGSSTATSSSWTNASTKVKTEYFKNLTATSGGTVTLTANWGSYSSVKLPTISKDGYTCQWKLTSTNGASFNSGATYTPAANSSFNATCTVSTYTVTWNRSTHCGSTNSTSTVNAGSTVGTLPSVTPSSDKVFDAWYTTSNGTTKVTTSTKPTSDVTYYAKCNAKTYNIKYTLNGGTHTQTPSSGTYGSVVNIKKPTKTCSVSFNNGGTTSGATYTSTSKSSTATFSGWTASGLTTSTAKYGTSSATVNTSWSSGSSKVTAEYFKNLTSTNGGTVTLTANWGNYASVTLPTVTKSGAVCHWNTRYAGGGNSYNSGGTVTNTDFVDYATTPDDSCALLLYAHCAVQNYQNTTKSTYHETLADAISNAAAGNTIKLLKNYTDTSTVTFNKNITFDTNGYTLTRNEKMIINSGVTVTKSGSGTIKTSSGAIFTVNGNLTVSAGTLSQTGNYITVYNTGTGTVTVSGGILTSSASGNAVIVNSSTGKIVVSSGTVSGTDYRGINNTAGGQVTISGGVVKASDAASVLNSGSGSISITGGTIGSNATSANVINNDSTGNVSITGGSFKCATSDSSTSCIKNNSSGTLTIKNVTISDAGGRVLYNGGTGRINVGDSGNGASDGKTTIKTSSTQYGALSCGNVESDSKCTCYIYDGAYIESKGYTVSNHGCDVRQFVGSKTYSTGTGTKHAALYNVSKAYSSSGDNYYGRVYIRQGVAEGAMNGIYSTTESTYAVKVGYESDTLFKTFSTSNSRSANGPTVLGTNSSSGRGVNTQNGSSNYWRYGNGVVAGNAYVSSEKEENLNKSSNNAISRDNCSIATGTSGDYTYYYLSC